MCLKRILVDWKAIQTQHAEQWAECFQGKTIKNTSSFHADYQVKKNEIPESAEAKDRRLDNEEKLKKMLDVFTDEEARKSRLMRPYLRLGSSCEEKASAGLPQVRNS